MCTVHYVMVSGSVYLKLEFYQILEVYVTIKLYLLYEYLQYFWGKGLLYKYYMTRYDCMSWILVRTPPPDFFSCEREL